MSDICNPTNAIDENFGENYVQLVQNENTLVGNFSNTTVNYKAINVQDMAVVK